ncbi:Abi family protein [Paludicola sp. MB14-C6]|uniref:Abi family protein n=1 Tax=Paludihabitans sp. MB14-C6 TaxID=3070656 RepID=UPI0027DBEE09|nr:Abi family protein [Paludicola sp. MB14-C6]WMJ24200.1 Abi family protein [Paludicola sp. MB14-C6]
MSNDYSPKLIEELIAHLKETKGIEVTSEHTRQMINYGYYHAYKGYRFFKKPKSYIPYTKFEELIAVIDYDNALKAAFYPVLMFLETALKNIVVANIVEGIPSADMKEVYRHRMNDEPGNEGLARQRAHLQEKVQMTITKRYSQNNSIIAHFHERGDQIPVWAVFEVLSLGDFATFCSCLNQYSRTTILRELSMVYNQDIESQLLTNILYALKDLRNAIAHNNVIFDTRFKEREENENIGKWLTVVTKIENIDFDSIFDYFILICVILHRIEYNDEKIEKYINDIEASVNVLFKQVPQNIYVKLTTTQYVTKMNALKEYIKNA